MLSRLTLRPLETKDIPSIVQWNEGTDEAFLRQWSGRNYSYPLTEAQMRQRIQPSPSVVTFAFLLGDTLVGTADLHGIDHERGTCTFGCFLIHAAKRGEGLGGEAIALATQYAFQTLGLHTVELSVFDFNQAALRCYQKAGFVETDRVSRPNGWVAIQMQLHRNP